jgi:hypothetical protein
VDGRREEEIRGKEMRRGKEEDRWDGERKVEIMQVEKKTEQNRVEKNRTNKNGSSSLVICLY